MTTERVGEIPWALSRLPRSGPILDVGSCGAEYLADLLTPTRVVHCLDPRPCHAEMPPGVWFHQTNLIHNQLPAASYDAILLVSVLEHIGLPAYGLEFFPDGDRRALIEIRRLLKPRSPAFGTVPADLHALFAGWRTEIQHWGYREGIYEPIEESEVQSYSNLEDFADPAFLDVLREVFKHEVAELGTGFPKGMEHRKHWEIVMAVLAFRRFGVLRPDSVVLGIGAGIEATIYYLTNHVKQGFAAERHTGGSAARTLVHSQTSIQ